MSLPSRKLGLASIAGLLASVLIVMAAFPIASGAATPPPSSTVAPVNQTCPSGKSLANRAYSPMFGDNDLQIFTTQPVLKPIAVVGGLNTPGEVVAADNGRELYINDWGTSSLKVFNTCTLAYTASIPVGSLSISSYLPANGTTSSGRYLYVGSTSSSQISVVDTWTNTVVNRYLVPGITNVQISPDGTRLYALTALGLLTLNPQTGVPVAPFLATGTLVPTWMTTTLDGSKLYLADTAGDAVTVVDAGSMTITKTIQFPFGTTPIVDKISPDGRDVWVADGASASGIEVISTATDSLVKTIPTNGTALYVSFSPDSSLAYVSEGGAESDSSHLGLLFLVAGMLKLPRENGDIRVINTASLQQVGPLVPTGSLPDDVSTMQSGVVEGG
jgi:hypothetical protein